ncbi:MAG: hypothetical protein PVF74_11100 [Anaerolineales bacterium]|jgi:hypothetical protein
MRLGCRSEKRTIGEVPNRLYGSLDGAQVPIGSGTVESACKQRSLPLASRSLVPVGPSPVPLLRLTLGRPGFPMVMALIPFPAYLWPHDSTNPKFHLDLSDKYDIISHYWSL